MNIINVGHDVSKKKAAELIGLLTFDFALPQNWLDAVSGILMRRNPEATEVYHEILGNVVWCYDYSPILGAPYPLTVKGFALLLAIDMARGEICYTDETHHQFTVLSIHEEVYACMTRRSLFDAR